MMHVSCSSCSLTQKLRHLHTLEPNGMETGLQGPLRTVHCPLGNMDRKYSRRILADAEQGMPKAVASSCGVHLIHAGDNLQNFSGHSSPWAAEA